jgi:hypothetical protein
VHSLTAFLGKVHLVCWAVLVVYRYRIQIDQCRRSRRDVAADLVMDLVVSVVQLLRSDSNSNSKS